MARGLTQRLGIDNDDPYSPVTRPDTIRMTLAVSAERGWKLQQFNMKTAFLDDRLEGDLYMRQLEGLDDQMDRVCQLHCSIYELKQSSICCLQCLMDFLEETGMKASSADPCMYYMEQKPTPRRVLVLFPCG